MLKLLTVLLAALLATGVHAQIFPRIEKDEVKKRVAGGGTQPEDEPDPKVDEKPADVDGALALARYNELMAQYARDEKTERKAMTKNTDLIHSSARDYLEGIFLLRMGFYKDAERKFKDVGVNVRNEREISTPELLVLSDEIKAGKAFYYRMIAAVMMEYSDFKTDKAADEAWSEAATKGIDIRRELETQMEKGKVAENSDFSQQMTAWMLTAKREWLALHKAETNVREHPENLNTWMFLVGATGIKSDDKREYTPNFFKQRAALTVVKEFWPDCLWVKGAIVDVGLGQNHLMVGQVEDIDQYYEKRAYFSNAGLLYLAKQKTALDEYKKTIEALKNK